VNSAEERWIRKLLNEGVALVNKHVPAGLRGDREAQSLVILRITRKFKREIQHAAAEADLSMQAWCMRAIHLELKRHRQRKESPHGRQSKSQPKPD
jgi:hypothetical protein